MDKKMNREELKKQILIYAQNLGEKCRTDNRPFEMTQTDKDSLVSTFDIPYWNYIPEGFRESIKNAFIAGYKFNYENYVGSANYKESDQTQNKEEKKEESIVFEYYSNRQSTARSEETRTVSKYSDKLTQAIDTMLEGILEYESDTFSASRSGVTQDEAMEIAANLILDKFFDENKCPGSCIDGIELEELLVFVGQD